MSKDEIRNLINEALSFGYHTAKDEAKGIPSAGYGTRFFNTYLIEQKLNIHGVMQGLPIEFVEWLGDHYIKMHGGWMPKYSNQIKQNLKTTMQIYEAYHALKDILNCPTIVHTGSPTVGKAGEDASVSDGK